MREVSPLHHRICMAFASGTRTRQRGAIRAGLRRDVTIHGAYQRASQRKCHYAESVAKSSSGSLRPRGRNPLASSAAFHRKIGMSARYYTVTWDQLHRDARALAWRLMEVGPFEGIVAISRGGLIPAAIVARELDLRLVESVCIVTYQDEEIGEPQVTKPPTAAGDGTGFLIIDDLVDSGTTARVVRSLLPKAHLACVYAKPAGRDMVDSFITEVSQDTWILFPWETESQFIAPLARRNGG
jgi:xanthine phosphoribosyltransferase